MTDNYKISQIQLPSPKDEDPHPSLLLDGYPIHAGECFSALFPNGWEDIRLEMKWETKGAACWYIAYPRNLSSVCPVGLFVRESTY